MTIKEVEGTAISDPRPACRLSMPLAVRGLMARDAMELPPVGITEFASYELSPLKNGDVDERYAQRENNTNGGRVESNENINRDAQADVTKNNRCYSVQKNEFYITTSVLNTLGESGDAKKNKLSQKTTPSDIIICLNQTQESGLSTKLNRMEANTPCQSQERKKPEICSNKEIEESFIRENIAGNNAGYNISEELLPIQLTVSPDGPIISTTAAPCTCSTCGEGIPSQPGGICKQCIHRGKQTDSKGGTLEEIIAYAQNLAWNVKKMFTTNVDPKSDTPAANSAGVIDTSQSTELSLKLQRYQSEIARQGCTASYVMGPDDRNPRKLSEMGTLSPLVYGDDVDAMSVADNEGPKEQRAKLEREASTLTNTDARPPMSRAKTKVRALFSSSRTKTFRSRIARTRTDHELKNDSVTSTLSCRMDSKKSSMPESTRKSGRTQTFDSSNLHLRKDVNRSRLSVMQEGTPVDPPTNDDKVSDKSHRYAISRSATSPGTPGLKTLQRERSNIGPGGPLVRTNTKLTLRANKAAVLRKENIHKATTLFHQQPAIDTSDGSPQLERKRGSTRPYGDARTKTKPLATINEKQSPAKSQVKATEDALTPLVGSDIKQEAKGIFEPASQKQSEQTDSEIYCGEKVYINESKTNNPYHEDALQIMKKRGKDEDEIAEKNPYCDDLHHYGKGLENQLLKQPVVENQSDLAMTPYFDKGVSKSTKNNVIQKEEDMNLYTDKQVVEQTSQSKPEKRSSSQWYSLRGVTSKSSTQLREATRVRSSFSEVEAARSSFMGSSGHARKHVKYSETDVDSGTIYHMAKRIASEQKVSSHNEFSGGSNFFETGGDVSKSSSSTSDNSSTGPDTVYTGGFFRDAFDESDEKDVTNSQSNVSEHAYFEYVREPKPEPIECDIYTGSVFSPSANNLALSGISDNWKNKSTNNSNRLPSHRYRSRTTMARISKRIILNCSNNSSSFVERNRSPSSVSFGPKVTQTLSSSYIDYKGCRRPLIQPVTIPLPETIDFTKYDKIGMGDTDIFFCSSPNNYNDKDSLYDSKAVFGKSSKSGDKNLHTEYANENLYTPGDRNSNVNNSKDEGETLNSNNNHFGDFYTGDVSHHLKASQERAANQTTASSNNFAVSSSHTYAPGSFYENAYAEPQRSPPRAQAPPSSFFGMFTGYGEPPAQQAQYSPDYAGSFSHAPLPEGRSRSPGTIYEAYGRPNSASPKRKSYELDGYFDYHSSDSLEDRRDFMDPQGRSRTPSVPRVKRVGAIICRENVANKDDYAEDVNRDLMEDSWVPISYRLAAEQVKEMGGGRCSSRELFKTTEAKCDSSLLDASPFAQGQLLEALGRKTGGWNLKQNTDSLKEDISMKWRDAREKGDREQQQQQKKKKSSDNMFNRTSVTSVWRPTDHIPAKARGNRTLVKSEPRGSTSLDKDGVNRNNSNPLDFKERERESGTVSSNGRSQKSSRLKRNKVQSPNPQPKVPDTLKKTQTNRERKRALFPSKAVIEYPKLKLRQPPPPPPTPPTPDVTTIVVRGMDTLLISICKNPEKCVMKPEDIDSSYNPFQQIISITDNEDLDNEVEAEANKSHPRPKPLNCFKPTRWALLEEGPKIETQPEQPIKENVETVQPKSGKSSLLSFEIRGLRETVQSNPGSFDNLADAKQEFDAVADGTSRDSRTETLQEANMSKEPKEDKGSGTENKAKDTESVNAVSKAGESEMEGRNFLSSIYSITDTEKDNEKIQEATKYLSFSEMDPGYSDKSQFSEKEEEEDEKEENKQWPFLKFRIDKENRPAYVLISEQLKDAQRLMDMPVRKREKRLWKASSTHSRRSSARSNIDLDFAKQ